MYLNDQRLTLNDGNVVRQPRLRVLNNGTLITGAIKASVHNVGHFHADSFDATFSLDSEAFGLGWWSSTDTILLDIQVSETGEDWRSLIVGQVDRIQSQLSTRTLHVEGRDLSARLIDLKLQDAYPNKTASEIATLLGARVGLSVQAQPTRQLTGTYYAGDHDELSNGQFARATTAWDLLTNLAQREGFDVWVTGTTLQFQPIGPTDPTPWLVRYQPPTGSSGVAVGSVGSTTTLSLDRALTLAKDIVVVVQGWSSEQGQKIKAVYPASHSASLHAAKSTLQQRVFTVANLKDTADALAKAQAFYHDIVKNERIIEWQEPGDNTLTCRAIVMLDGTQSSFDQTYYIDTITRDISIDGGFEMTVRAKNQSTATQTTVG